MKKAVFGLEPLGCPSCVKKIENTVRKMHGVQEVKVLFNSNKVSAQFDEGVVQAEQIHEVITKLGYPVVSQKVSYERREYHERKTYFTNYRRDRYSSCDGIRPPFRRSSRMASGNAHCGDYYRSSPDRYQSV